VTAAIDFTGAHRAPVQKCEIGNYMLKLVSLDKVGRFDGGAFVFAQWSPAGD
jgi:hypothetical protein